MSTFICDSFSHFTGLSCYPHSVDFIMHDGFGNIEHDQCLPLQGNIAVDTAWFLEKHHEFKQAGISNTVCEDPEVLGYLKWVTKIMAGNVPSLPPFGKDAEYAQSTFFELPGGKIGELKLNPFAGAMPRV